MPVSLARRVGAYRGRGFKLSLFFGIQNPNRVSLALTSPDRQVEAGLAPEELGPRAQQQLLALLHHTFTDHTQPFSGGAQHLLNLIPPNFTNLQLSVNAKWLHLFLQKMYRAWRQKVGMIVVAAAASSDAAGLGTGFFLWFKVVRRLLPRFTIVVR